MAMSVREMPEREQDDQDNEQDTDDTAWPPSIVPGIRPSWEGTDQQQNENDDENRDQHGPSDWHKAYVPVSYSGHIRQAQDGQSGRP
jgi:hypothetical protein